MKESRILQAVIGAAILASLGIGFSLWNPGAKTRLTHKRLDPRSKEAIAVGDERKLGDRIYAKNDLSEAAKFYQGFVGKYADSGDEFIQDEVGAARLRLGYIAGKQKNFSKAREEFQKADEEYKGTGALNPDYGGIPDQAAYQACVTFAAEGKTEEAEQAFTKFIEERWESPLIHASYKRLLRLNGGESKPEWDALLQKSIDKQQAKIRRESAMCGPKVIAYLLKTALHKEVDYEEIARQAKTNDDGTTLQNMIDCLKSYGISAKGYQLNAADFAKVKAPAIWLQPGHYVLITDINLDNITYYDPLLKSTRTIKLPDPTDSKFIANVLKLDMTIGEKQS